MCTISWVVEPEGYQVFFNRDEQKTRALALPPQVITENGIRSVMPTDPEGGGTWIASNEHGITVALLNFYQGDLPEGALVSRGKIVHRLAAVQNLAEAEEIVRAFDLSCYAPFSLVILSANQLYKNKQRIKVMRWDGKQLKDFKCASPLISSGVEFENVSKNRLRLYREQFGELLTTKAPMCGSQLNSTIERLRKYHASHDPEASAYSVCMHREDAHTVSFCHISVTTKETVFKYTDGAPCSAQHEYSVTLHRKSEGRESAKGDVKKRQD